MDAPIAVRAKELESFGFRAMDALHLACAEAVRADEFSTCDDRLLKKARSRSDLTINVIGPLQLFDKVFP